MNAKKNESKGITLIALVISIIVLLILAGVTIAALSGDNGILTRAKEAKEKTNTSDIIEEINLAIITSTTETSGNIDKEMLRKELENKNIKVETEDNEFPWKINYKEKIFEIDENFNVKEISEKMKINVSAEQINLSPERYYGKIALNYTKENLTYRIFYVDKNNEFGDGKNTIYLKADWNENNIRLTDYIKYEPKDKDLEIYKRMNKKWSEKRGTLKSSSWNDNERAVSWLSSASQWEKYKDNSKANYAIGTPSVEMYVASYNQVSHKEIGNYILGAEYREIEVPGYIYTLDGKQSTVSNNDYYAGTDTIDYKGYGGMYAGRKSSKYFWLASPLSEGINYVCMISGNYAGLSKDNYTGLNGICPTICIKEGIKIEVEE